MPHFERRLLRELQRSRSTPGRWEAALERGRAVRRKRRATLASAVLARSFSEVSRSGRENSFARRTTGQRLRRSGWRRSRSIDLPLGQCEGHLDSRIYPWRVMDRFLLRDFYPEQCPAATIETRLKENSKEGAAADTSQTVSAIGRPLTIGWRHLTTACADCPLGSDKLSKPPNLGHRPHNRDVSKTPRDTGASRLTTRRGVDIRASGGQFGLPSMAQHWRL